MRRGAARSGRVVRLARDRRLHGQPGGGLRQPARDAASWWLIVDVDARALRWHRNEFESGEAPAAGV